MNYKIGDFSRLCRVSVRTIRYYDEIGLLKPVSVDQNTGYRYYSIEQVPVLNRIIALKSMGLSLDDIDKVLHDDVPVDHIRQLLQVKKTEIQERLKQDSIRLRQVEGWLGKICNESIIPEGIYLQRKTVAPVRVISKRELGAYEETSTRLLEELRQQIHRPENRESVIISGPLMMLCYDEEFKEEDADIEIALPITGEMPVVEDSIDIKFLPECKVVSSIYEGSYDKMDQAYAQIFEYAEDNNLKLGPPVRELYFNYLGEVPEEELLTEIQFPYQESGE
jgi:effector-binding domain-containing protein